MQPRWYQADLIKKTRDCWSQGYQNVLTVASPRSGKTPTFLWLAEPFLLNNQGVIINVHREELVSQIAMTAAEFGHQHNIVAPDNVKSAIVQKQVKRFGQSISNQKANLWIGSVQPGNARSDKLKRFANRVGLWIIDAAHHVLSDNMWGKIIKLFPNANGLGVTATPGRTDRKSLARSQGGVFDVMVKGPTARQLINEGWICDYRIIAPPSSIDRQRIKVGAKGEFTQKGLTEARRDSKITGDCVDSYLTYAPGTQAVCFAVDIEHARDLSEAYRDAGVSAEFVSSKTDKRSRPLIMDKFRRGVFQVLVNVDLFGEGLDVKTVETVVMARPTQSFVLYVQQFFRPLTRGADGKIGTIIDHAGNVGFFGKTYGLPDSYNGWKLESDERSRKSRASDPNFIPITTCTECFNVYEAVKKECPFCGHVDEPADRKNIEHVAGDLVELERDILEMMRGEADRIIGDPIIPIGTSYAAQASVQRDWIRRREAQAGLRDAIARWAGIWRYRGRNDSEIHRIFFIKFGIDVLSAQALSKKDANELCDRVDNQIKSMLTTVNNT